MGSHPNLLLIVVACAAKEALKHRPRRRRQHQQQRSDASWSDTSSDTSSSSLHSHQLDIEDAHSLALLPPTPPPRWCTCLTLLLAQQLSAVVQAALAAVVADVMSLVLRLVHCHWTLRWLLAVQASAAEAFVADFDLFGHWATPMISAPSAAPAPTAPLAAHEINSWLAGSWNLSKAWDMAEQQPSAAELLRLGGLARTGMRMFKGMEFSLDQDRLFMTALTKLPWLKVSPEVYGCDSSISSHNRRDMRKGKSLGYIKVLAAGGVDLYNTWQEPVAGSCIDEMRVVGPDELHITTHLQVGAQSGSYCVVYSRARGARGRGKAAALPATAPAAPPAAPGLKHVPSLPRIAEFPEALGQRNGARFGLGQLVS